MSQSALLRALVAQRLTAAAEDICALFERTIAEYEQEVLLLTHNNSSQQQRPGSQLLRTDAQIEDAVGVPEVKGGIGITEDTKVGHAAWSWEPLIEKSQTSVTTEDLSLVDHRVKAPVVKNNPELCVKQEEDLPLIVTVKTEDEEVKSSVLHQRLTEESREANGGAANGGAANGGAANGGTANGEVDNGAASGRAGCSSAPFPRPPLAGPWTPNRPPLKRGYAKNRRYQCPHCVKRFVRNAELQRHVLIHTGQRPFVCSVCGRGFRVVYQLQSHMRTHTGEKTCFCHICNKGFSTKSLLTEHMRVHTGDKPFRCPVCNRGFTQRGNVTAHVRTHTGEKPYSCHLCNRCFTQKSTLDKHVATHRRENHAGTQNSAYAAY